MPTVADVKAIASGNAKIQALSGTEDIWALVFAEVEKTVTARIYGPLTFEAQLYLSAHLLTMALGPQYGQGQTSSESVGGVSRSTQAAWLTYKSALGSTAYGQRFLELRNGTVVPFMMVKP